VRPSPKTDANNFSAALYGAARLAATVTDVTAPRIRYLRLSLCVHTDAATHRARLNDTPPKLKR